MRPVKRGRHEKADCRHRKTKSSETAGLRRTVCQRCGAVTVDFLYDVFAEEQEQLGRMDFSEDIPAGATPPRPSRTASNRLPIRELIESPFDQPVHDAATD